jgi:hypothetical protein
MLAYIQQWGRKITDDFGPLDGASLVVYLKTSSGEA